MRSSLNEGRRVVVPHILYVLYRFPHKGGGSECVFVVVVAAKSKIEQKVSGLLKREGALHD